VRSYLCIPTQEIWSGLYVMKPLLAASSCCGSGRIG
jgi:hypothetical protein